MGVILDCSSHLSVQLTKALEPLPPEGHSDPFARPSSPSSGVPASHVVASIDDAACHEHAASPAAVQEIPKYIEVLKAINNPST